MAGHSVLIQTRGAALGVRQASERVVLVSANIEDILGLSVDQVLDQSVVDVLGREVTHALRNAETLPTLGRRRQWLGYFDLNGQSFFLSVFVSAGILLIELLPSESDREPAANEVLNDVLVLTDVVLSAKSSQDLFEQFAALLRTVSGYHCVAVDRLTGGHREQITAVGRVGLGDVVCEAPPQLHAVEDIVQPAVALVATQDGFAADMGLSVLRLPADDVCDSLRTHGVGACASVVLLRGSETWGCLKLLHETSRLPNRRTQFALAHLAPLLAERLLQLE